MSPFFPSLFDITLKLSSHTLLYPGDPVPLVTRTSDLRQGDSLTASHLSVSCHVGTHVDSPAHFIEHGATLDDLPLDSFYGPAVVVDLVGKAVIEVADFTSVEIPTSHHILLKTDNSAFLQLDTFASSYCVFSPEAAEYLADLNPVINRGNARGDVFHRRGDYQTFADLLGLACARLPMRILAYCLMPNQFHLALWPYQDGDLSRWMQWLLTAHVRRYHWHYQSRGHIWQGRFMAFPIKGHSTSRTRRKRVRVNATRGLEWPSNLSH